MSELMVTNFAEGQELARSLKQSALVPEALRGKEADILFIVLTGAEMGMGPMRSLQAFESIKGRVGMKPVYMLGMVRAHPTIKFIKLETSPTGAVVTSQRKGENDVLRTEFTMVDATRAGLTSSDMYRKWGPQMCGWRCVAIHCRAHHSDITGGHYSTEEVETFERDVTPPKASPPAPATVDDVKAKLRKQLIRESPTVDAPLPSPPPPSEANQPSTTDSGVRLDWPPNYAAQGLTVGDLRDEQLDWCVRKATEKAEVGGDDRELWAHRLLTFTDECSRRAALQSEVVP